MKTLNKCHKVVTELGVSGTKFEPGVTKLHLKSVTTKILEVLKIKKNKKVSQSLGQVSQTLSQKRATL